MKSNKLWSLMTSLVIALSATIVFSSCGKDDDDNDETISGAGIYKNHEYVDLGLSVKWATCNIGANAPEEYGDYFAWGETEPKDYFDWRNYKWCEGSYDTLTKYCTDSNYGIVDGKTTIESADDAATANWGGKWRMPTKAEQDELRTKCKLSLTTLNNVVGCMVTGPNGNSIFIPFAGYIWHDELRDPGSHAEFWSSSLSPEYDGDRNAFILWFKRSNICGWEYYYRCYGQTIRPVCP